MATQHKQGYCKQCKQIRPVMRPGTNHILHLILSIVTAGIWVIVWILAAVKIGGWRCESCGGSQISKVN